MKDDVALTLQLADAHRAVLDASALADHPHAALALVVETEGSTYVRSGAMALFDGRGGQVGWLSGGCLEPEIEARALAAAQAGRLDWMDVDTRDDEDLLSGSAVGCRGHLQLALLPLAALPGWGEAVLAWRAGGDVHLTLQPSDAARVVLGFGAQRWELDCAPVPASLQCGVALLFKAPPQVLLFGAGPESPHLLPLLRDAGWVTTLVERRPRWSPSAERPLPVDAWQPLTPAAATQLPALVGADAALVMNHNFELDRETLEALAATDIPFIGLLGPQRRREDLFRLLPPSATDALGKRLRSPVGLDLGGRGAHAIALSIAAQLQAWHHGRAA
ncbi:xanthine dehydrogenase accessory factor [Pseudoxanthomonas sp. GM95]|uniref:XdhC family protein n=1 Tax=Pseudoxanthomonas sp. GM95 TaxID=1881043 RepID=UPI0008D3A8C9|nr:XdhC/CoxI family protein [Pseudoxanthomonas sp. GM95]SEL50420.1 xanthine dehydrogenase accessory factor [Pseudoxanthomonas sp. GM95]